MVIDIIDNFSIFTRQGEKRVKFYKNIGDNVKTVPQVFIDDIRIGGYQDLRAWLNG